MFTCCPHCNSCFRITKPQLEVAQGKVRCGSCSMVFNGKAHLRDDMPKPAAARPSAAPAVKKATPPPPPVPPIPVEPEAPAAPREESKKDPFDIDLDLYSADDSQLIDDEDDSWLDRLDEDEHEASSSRLSDSEEDELDELFDDEEEENEDQTEIIDIADASNDIFASLGIDVDKVADEAPPVESVPEPVQTKAPAPPPVEPEENNRYEYYDPDELLDEEKGIDEILKEMDAQLSLEIEQPGFDSHQLKLPEDNSTRIGKGAKPQAKAQQQKDNPFDAIANGDSAEKKQDNFETEFLASLDSTLSDAKKPKANKSKPAKQKPAAKKPAAKTEKKKPTAPQAPQADDDDVFGFGDTFSGTQNDLPGGDEEEIPFQLRDSFDPNEENKTWLKLVWLSAMLLLSLVLLIQLAVFRSTDIVDKMPALQPVISGLCSTFPCRYTGQQDVSQIKLVSRDIRVHPKVENALLITATLVNRAKFKQPYPDLQISLSDLSGEVVAERRFSPQEYLANIQSPFLRMPAGKPVKIALEVIDPGQDAVNFEIRFR